MVDSTPFGKETLRGLSGTAVAVEKIVLPEALEAGLSQEDLRRQVEERLYQAGIALVAFEAVGSLPQAPVLYLRLSVLKVGPKAFVYGINLYMMQTAFLAGGQQTQVLTWERGLIGSVVQDQWAGVKENLDRSVDAFIADFKEVNPMGQEAPRGDLQ